jgi:cholesterol transport system auxiliary component
MKLIAAYAYSTRAYVAFGLKTLSAALLFVLAGCSVLQAPVRPAVYDFGPGVSAIAAVKLPLNATAVRPGPVVLAEFDTTPAMDTTAVLFRLNYADPQQLRPYAQARWSMTPAQLLRQRLKETLGQQRDVLSPSEGIAAAAGSVTLRITLEEFSHNFETELQSSGLVRVRATLSQPVNGVDRLLAQRSFAQQHSSRTADAVGGVKALTAASDATVSELIAWLKQSTPAVK